MRYIPVEPYVPPALFDLEDVEARIVMLASVVPDARHYFRRLRELGYRRKKMREDGVMGKIERARYAYLCEEVDRLTLLVEDCVDDVARLGGQIVDLERGEVTFATILEGEEAYYVWTPGDLVVQWYRLATEPVGEAHLIGG